MPQPIPFPENRVEFKVEGPAWALVVDWPQQRSIGVVPPGIVLNQIARSTTTGVKSEPQFTVIPVAEEEGIESYYVVLYGRDWGGEVTVEVRGYTGGENVFTFNEDGIEVQAYAKSGKQETKYVAKLEVEVDADGNIAGGEFGEFVMAREHPDSELWTEKGPGHLEIKDWATVRVDETIAPQANFSASMKDGKLNFTNFSTGDIVGYSWDFGDGNISVEMNPFHEYGEGEYTVSLTVSGPTGENDTARITIYVFTAPAI